MMVPVFHDVGREQTKVWVFLGWDRTLLHVDYEVTPQVLSCEWLPADPPEPGRTDRLGVLRRKFRPAPGTQPPPEPQLEFRSEYREAATPVFAEVYVDRLLDWDEFRRLCDRHRTAPEILAHLR